MTVSDKDLKYISENVIYAIPIPVGGGYVTYTDIQDMATELLSRREADRWIPITDTNKPQAFVDVLLGNNNVDPNEDADHRAFICSVGYRTGENIYESPQISNPTHYRPLPEPPERPCKS